jgi:hypothetical protein
MEMAMFDLSIFWTIYIPFVALILCACVDWLQQHFHASIKTRDLRSPSTPLKTQTILAIVPTSGHGGAARKTHALPQRNPSQF